MSAKPFTPINPEELSEDYFANVHGKRYILHQGLLKLAHENGPINISVEIVSYAGVGAEAVVTATASGPRGTFSDVGDAAPENTRLRSATLRLASTRAINRALRLYLGVGMTSLEEMPLDENNEIMKDTPPLQADDPYYSGGGMQEAKPRRRKKSNKKYGNWDGMKVYGECPDCGDGVWDNRENRRNPKAPVFKCRDADGCGWIAWPQKVVTVPTMGDEKLSSYQPQDHMTDAEVQEVF